jgi:putative transposase
MKEYQSLSHTTWDCKYHVVFIPKCRKQRIFGALRRELGSIFHELAGQKESRIVEGHLMPDHVHICISIPPKYAVLGQALLGQRLLLCHSWSDDRRDDQGVFGASL